MTFTCTGKKKEERRSSQCQNIGGWEANQGEEEEQTVIVNCCFSSQVQRWKSMKISHHDYSDQNGQLSDYHGIVKGALCNFLTTQ